MIDGGAPRLARNPSVVPRPEDAASNEAAVGLLVEAARDRPAPIRMVEFERRLGSQSRPYVLLDDDNNRYVVKSRGVGRSTYNDQVVGRLGMAMGAAVAEVALVEVPQELVDARWADLTDLAAGIAHGSRVIPQVLDVPQEILYADRPENRPRFASLALLYGWCQVEGDHQFIHELGLPQRVYSHDHGEFFPGGPRWSAASLHRAQPCRPDRFITVGAGLGEAELRAAAAGVAGVSAADIAASVAAPPDDWGVSFDERVALVRFLVERQRTLLTTLTRRPGQE